MELRLNKLHIEKPVLKLSKKELYLKSIVETESSLFSMLDSRWYYS